MNLFKKVDNDITKIIHDYVGDVYIENARLSSNVRFVIPPVQTGCDYSTNAAMVFAKSLNKSPIICATEMAEKIEKLDYIEKVEVVKGYINIVFKDKIWETFLSDINVEKSRFGDGDLKGDILLCTRRQL